MIYVITALAVYKAIHLTTSLLPREVMPWVKVVAGVAFSLGATALVWSRFDESSFGNYLVSSLAVATLAGVTHSVIRLITYLGDMAARRATR